MQLAIASANPGKLKEFRLLFQPMGVEITSLAELGAPQANETGETFEENARLKAVALAKATGLWALADDSGLEVDALDGEPGVYSARYAGEGASDEANVAKLLDRLAGVPDEKRGAQFRCVLALAAPDGRVWTEEGICRGRIALRPSGNQGFGYDPVFVPQGHVETFAEMSPENKAAMSHRGIAMRRMLATFEASGALG